MASEWCGYKTPQRVGQCLTGLLHVPCLRCYTAFALFNRDSPYVHVVVTVLAVLLALRYLSALCLPSFAFKEVPYVFVRPDCPVPAFEESCLLSMMLRASRNDGAQCAPAAC